MGPGARALRAAPPISTPTRPPPLAPPTTTTLPTGYEACVPRIVRVLERCKQRDVSQDYTYYCLASPWLHVICIRVLQYFPPPEDLAVRRMRSEVSKSFPGGGSAGPSAVGVLPAGAAAGVRWRVLGGALVP